MKEEISKILEETFKSHVPGQMPEDVADLTKLLADATTAYVSVMADPTISVEAIQMEYVAQVQTAMENLRFEALNMRLSAVEVVALMSKLIPIIMSA